VGRRQSLLSQGVGAGSEAVRCEVAAVCVEVKFSQNCSARSRTFCRISSHTTPQRSFRKFLDTFRRPSETCRLAGIFRRMLAIKRNFDWNDETILIVLP